MGDSPFPVEEGEGGCEPESAARAGGWKPHPGWMVGDAAPLDHFVVGQVAAEREVQFSLKYMF